MNVLITGGTGFIGSSLAKELLADGNSVVIYDSSITASRISSIADQVNVIQGDVCDLECLLKTIRTYKVNRIAHLAYMMPETAILANPMQAIRVNALGSTCILEAARLAEIERVVYASTDAVNPLGPHEHDPVNPDTLYGHLKYLNEATAVRYDSGFGLDSIGLRFGLNYGPGERLAAGELPRKYATAIVALIVENAVMGKPAQSPFPRSALFHCMYIEDTVRVLMLALKAPRTTNRIFNVCGEETHNLGEIVDIVKRIIPTFEIVFGPENQTPVPIAKAVRLDCSAAREQLGYEPAYSLEKGLHKYISLITDRSN